MLNINWNTFLARKKRISGLGLNNRLLTVQNPFPRHKIWRSGTSYSALITPPKNYSTITWQILDHKTGNAVTSGSGPIVTNSFTFNGTSDVYDLKVNTTNGVTPIERIFLAEFTCLPPKFTRAEADEIWDLSTTGLGNKDGEWIDRPGYKIWIENSGSGRLNPYYYRSSVASNPVRMALAGATINNTTFNFTPGPCENVVWDGCINEDLDYGLTLVKSNGGTDQLMINYGSDTTHSSKNIIFCGIEANGRNVAGTGIQMATSNNATYNYDTYTFDNPTLFNCYVHDTYDEGYYIAHFTDLADTSGPNSGRAYSRYSNGLFFRLKSLNTGNEGFQFGSNISSDVFCCDFRNPGTRDQSSHQNAFQWSDGNRDCSFYCNYMETARNIFSGFTGRGGRDNEYFANVVKSTGKTASGVNWFVKVQANDTYSTLYWGAFNNTLVMNTGIPLSLYNDTGSPTIIFNPFIWADNTIISDTATTHEVVNGFNTTNLTVNNLQSLDIDYPLFFDRTSNNFKIAALSSPMFRTKTSFTRKHRMAGYDFEGVKYIVDTACAYSGYELYTLTPATKIVSSVFTQTPLTNVANGTSFASLLALLPTKVLTRMTDTSTRAITVTWTQGSYNGSVQGTYIINGTLSSLPSDVTNPNSIDTSISVTVAAALSPYNANIAFGDTTAETGWLRTGSTSPYPGSSTNVTFNLTNDANNTDPDLQIIALNTDATNRWNQIITNTTVAFTGPPSIPNSVQTKAWNTDANGGTPRNGIINLVNKSGGSNPLLGRSFTLKVICTRTGTAGARNQQVTINSGTPQTVDVKNNNTVVLTFTGITLVSGKIEIKVNSTTPTDSVQSYINAIIITSE